MILWMSQKARNPSSLIRDSFLAPVLDSNSVHEHEEEALTTNYNGPLQYLIIG